MSMMVHGVCAMKKESRPRKISLSLPILPTPTVTLTSSGGSPKLSPNSNNSPQGSPNLSANPSPHNSPRISPKESKKERIARDERIHYQEYFESSIWDAVENNDTEAALSFIHQNMDITDHNSKNGKTILIKAINNKNEVIVKSLLEQKNIDVNKVDKHGNTPLHYAVLACNEVIIRLLLDDYRINSFIQNPNSRRYPHDLADDTFYMDKLALKEMLKARQDLDIIVSDKAFALGSLQIKDNVNFTIYDLDDDAIASAKNLVHENQKSLPYVTDKFIKKMMLYRIAEYNKTKK